MQSNKYALFRVIIYSIYVHIIIAQPFFSSYYFVIELLFITAFQYLRANCVYTINRIYHVKWNTQTFLLSI